MDARNDRGYNAGRAGTHCRGLGPGPALHGLGFYAFQFPEDPGAGHQGLLRLPVVEVGLAYRQVLPAARLVYLHPAGHNAYQDQPTLFLAVVRAFLTGRPLPVAPWTTSAVPADYEGPR
jgi:hypothetical protein